MELYVDTNAPAMVIAAGDIYGGVITCKEQGAAGTACIGTDGAKLKLPNMRYIVSLLPTSGESGLLFPITVGLEPSGRLASLCPNCRTIDWGDEVIELCADFVPIPRAVNSPSLLQRINFPARDGRRRNVELYRDNGIRLSVEEGGAERSFILCGGTEGSMRVLDVGRERLLIVHAKDGDTERLMALEGHFEVVAAIEGTRCSVDDGYLTAIAPLGTVLGHERRTRYELRAGRLDRLPDEVGFYSHSPIFPSDAVGVSLALMEEVMLKRADELERLMCQELRESLELSDLCEFFGDFDETRAAPWQDIGGDSGVDEERVILGAVKDGKAKKFVFTVKNERITDITNTEED